MVYLLTKSVGFVTLQETNISHLGKRKIIFKYALSGGYVNSLEGTTKMRAVHWARCRFGSETNFLGRKKKSSQDLDSRLKNHGDRFCPPSRVISH